MNGDLSLTLQPKLKLNIYAFSIFKNNKSAIKDISWAFYSGRSFKLITTCGKDGIFVWKIRFEGENPTILNVL